MTDPGAPASPPVCPDCGCRHFHKLAPRPAPRGKVRTRRECRHCGRVLTTTEPAGPLPEP